MRNIFYTIIISFAIMMASCGQHKEQSKKTSAGDSIKKADSISNLLIGTWKEKGKPTSIKIVKAGELYTITNSSGVTFAYKLNGQILNSVDGTGPAYSIINSNEILKGSIVYNKSGKDDDDNNSSTSTEPEKKSKSHASKSKTAKPAAVSDNDAPATAAPAVTATPKELSIVCDNTINLKQTPSNSSIVVRGLTNGQVCKLLEKGKKATVSGKTDYWYKVSAEGDIGWVFGAYTSIHQ